MSPERLEEEVTYLQGRLRDLEYKFKWLVSDHLKGYAMHCGCDVCLNVRVVAHQIDLD
jgi:hypothetical protein